ITGEDGLDLEGCRIPRDIGLIYCRFQKAPVLRSAQIDNLFLNGSALPGLSADRLEAKGNVSLDGVVTTGRVRLLGAKLGGDLDCDGAQLTAVKDGDALSLDNARIEGAFFLREKARINGILGLSGATLGAIIDEEACWPDAGNLILERCQYGAFTGGSVTADARIKWLSLQNPARFGADFWPQPWEQCAKVLREMGHGDDARAVLIDKEKRQRADQRKGYWFGRRGLWWVKDFLLWVMVAYGHKPRRAFYWLGVFWIIGVGVFYMAEQYDAIKPNDVRIMRSPEWAFCHPEYNDEGARNNGTSQIDCFLDQPEAASYPRFNAWVYSADTLLPIVALEMQ
ncbi:MAG: hypothetical protein KAT26_01335, partial [Marinosulfonomonas sp.]|nr:hypothetical protein [Marinosulfonomonas sp.]